MALGEIDVTQSALKLPHAIETEEGEVVIRRMTPADGDAVLAFAAGLPAHDLLFLPRDISSPKVMRAWIREIEAGAMESLVAERDRKIVGCGTLVSDPLSWSPHVCEMRVVVSSDVRGAGVGRALMRDCFQLALDRGARKIVAQMTADQKAAISLFEGIGFKAEAMLRDHVRDRAGKMHDLVVLSQDVARFAAQLNAFGVGAQA